MITFTYSLLLLVGVLSIVPVFCGLVGGGSLGRVCHSGEVVSHRDASRDDPFHSWRKPSWSHTYNAWWIPVIARRISVAAASLISSDACSLYQAVCGVQMRFGASFNGP